MYADVVDVTASQYETLRGLIRSDKLIYHPGTWGALIRKGFVITQAGKIVVTDMGWRAFHEATESFKQIMSYVQNNPECELKYGGILVPRAMPAVKVLRDLGYFSGDKVFRKTEKFTKVINSVGFPRRKFL